MLSFKEFLYETFLMESEARIEHARKMFEPKFKEKFGDQHQAVFDKVVENDPSKNKQYTHWIARQVEKHNLKPEDLYKTKEDLEKFEKGKNRLPADQRDINKHTHKSLYDTVKDLGDVKSNKEAKKEHHQEMMKDVTTVYDGPHGKVQIPHTEEASCHLGKGTRWCTAASKSNNMFSHYNSQGPLHVITTPDNTKFQYHHQSGQLMDEEDSPVSDSHIKKYPILHHVINDQAHKNESLKDEFHKHYDPETWDAAVEKNYDLNIPESTGVAKGKHAALIDKLIRAAR